MRARERPAGPLGRTLAAVAVSSCFAAPAALANPTGADVVRGTAAIHQAGNLLQITNSPNAIINWQSFSIGANEITRFIQQSPASAVLNRVTTQNPSQILGTLQSNGRVFLINPNGILFGAGAQVDVAGLVASTLNMSDQDFLAGRMRFTDGLGKSVVNDGSIATGAGGSVYLVGSGVTNNGIIRSPQGEVVLAAGNSVELVSPGTPNLRVEIDATDNEARNLGQILSEAGRIGIYAGLINNSGQIRADSAVSEGGRILLKASKNTTLDAGSLTTANGTTGGGVTIQSAGTTLVSGSVEATGTSGQGGSVQVLGHLVGLTGNATIDASGETGGGTVLVGGDFQGRNPEVQNAFRTYLGPDATIGADALTSGDGGKVVVWADDTTRAYGTISARGGVSSGNGGFVEVSGKGALDFDAKVDTRAPNGMIGTLLLDPANINVAVGGTAPITEVDAFADAGATLTISPTALNAAGATVVLQATNDIAVNDPVNLTTPLAGFVAQAGRHIDINATVTTNGGVIHLEGDSPHQPGGPDGAGLVTIGAAVNSNGGKITLIGGGNSNPQGGFKLDADVNAGSGGINVALSTGTADLDFFIGAGGNTQLSSNDTGSLKTTGALVLGSATTAGTNGLGSGSVLLTVNSITNATANPIQLSADSGSSFELIAGAGGITLDRPLTSFQDMVITTSGDLTVNQTLGTSGNDLTIHAANVILGPNGSINVGNGTFTCTGTGCAPLTGVFWDGGGSDLNWFNPLNWSGDLVPDGTTDVTIETATGAVLIAGGAATARSLISLEPIDLSSGSLTLTNASTFSNSLTISGGTLSGAGIVSVGGPGGSLTWSGGTMANGGGTFFLGAGQPGSLSGSLTLDRVFQNDGLLTLSGATITGAGSITNNGTLTASGTNAVAKMLLALGSVNGAGSLTVNDWSRTGGTFNMAGSADLRVPGGNFSVDHAYTAGNLTLRAPAGDIVLNSPVTGTGGSGTTVALAAGNNFINNFGANAIDPGAGRFLVYSTNPANDTRGGLVYDFKQYDATFGSTAVLGAGDGFLYSIAPVIAPSLTGTATKVYDGSMTAPAGSLVLSATGAIDGDVVVLASTGATYDTQHVGTGKSVTANGLSVTGGNGATTVYGYQLSNSAASANIGEITPATLTYVADASSRERGDPNVLSGNVTGFVGGETLATATSGTLGFTSPATQSSLEGVYAVNGGGLTANNGNYVLVQAPGNATALTVTPPVNFAWTSATGGAWETGSNWSKGFAPVDGAVVTIPDIGAAGVTETITFSIGTANIKTVTSLEALTLAGGTLNLGTGSADISSIPVVNLNGGTLAGTGALNLSSINLNGGMLTGNLLVTANVSNQGGTVTPGASPGALTINGNYVQGPGGTLVVEIGGTTGGSQYDQLIVNGNVTLGGTLNVTLVNGYVPAGGETFGVVQSSGAVSGTFASTNFPAIPTFTAAYLPAGVQLLASIPVPPGAVAAASQVVVALTDQNQNTLVASQLTGLPVELYESQQQEQQATRKMPICNASSSGGGGGGGGPAGGGGFRCYSRGCF
jgi:filamentous hemagglutinin family protein